MVWCKCVSQHNAMEINFLVKESVLWLSESRDKMVRAQKEIPLMGPEGDKY